MSSSWFLAGILTVLARAALAGSGPYELTVWNQHNGAARDRGTRVFNVDALSGGSAVWKQEKVALEWAGDADPKVTIVIPAQLATIERIRITITEFVGWGGGFSEIQLKQNGTNLAPRCQVIASSFYGKDPRYAPKNVIDGITTSGDSVGYWLLADRKLGWIELKLPRD